ncbi:Histone acetyltransferase HPA2 [Pseudonocardia sp. Ae717_Ps2]|uniref:GNAT family N-acetyltransferase n=1 Tax=unclassified Pseudonocardia TaxID=2619320 RepID=UPI00094B15D7|nr:MULTISPECIES: GNAT family N-acetyltransferase [unclassified Pseudonocardia]OLM11525.1 Histone acetyltransferase HPA2 [Pseudonocardia sp. Ae505_Ps2]OLM34626.1 Histone acetyltransferase HPA2 [Pseudonocardia sp. Ae717_Ps2]
MKDPAGKPSTSDLLLRPAKPDDIETLHRFVVELADEESFPGDVIAKPADLAAALFGPSPLAESVVAAMGDQLVGFALFYPTYSTILGRPGIHLEDLYVDGAFRGRGIGEALLGHLADLATERGCGRLEWWVLRTNVSAIRFYERLNARGLDEIEVMRLDDGSLFEFGSRRTA